MTEKAVMVVGGGVSGIQASLDLAARGFKVYLVEKSPSIGGRMAQLDKTFPTMDCSMCILAPKMIECSHHPNIQLLTYSEVKNVRGSVGAFTVTVLRKPRYVDESKCTGCGTCSASCPPGRKTGFRTRLFIRRCVLGFRDKVLSDSHVWDCTTCYTCAQRCPRDANPMEILIGVRSLLVEEGRIPPTLKEVLEGVFKYGNPWGISPTKRSEWARDLKVKYATEGEKAKLLYFVGCASSYDSRAQEVARALVKNLNALGVNFSILGNKERCCGNEIYSLGEKGLFEILVEDNLKLLDQHGINRIISTSPHCFNVFKNRYGREDLTVQHYTQFFADMIDKEKLKFSGKIEKVITYQDPCFLGKHNNIYEEPRKILEAIPGIKFSELTLSKRRSICCEGGGGRMWYDIPEEKERLAEARVKEAVDIGAEILAVACPFCLLTLDDAVKTTGNEERIQVMDIMELVAEAL